MEMLPDAGLPSGLPAITTLRFCTCGLPEGLARPHDPVTGFCTVTLNCEPSPDWPEMVVALGDRAHTASGITSRVRTGPASCSDRTAVWLAGVDDVASVPSGGGAAMVVVSMTVLPGASVGPVPLSRGVEAHAAARASQPTTSTRQHRRRSTMTSQ